MTWTYKPLNPLADLFSKPLMMAMLTSLFLGSIWGEVMTTRFEFKPALTSYTVLCNHSHVRQFRWTESWCKNEESKTTAALVPQTPIVSEVR